MRSEMKCDDAFEALSAGLDGELGDTERPRLRHHLASCDRCRERDAELRAVHRQMRSALRAAAPAVRPPERLRLRIERDCTPVAPRLSPFSFGIALTGAGALGALLALAFRSPSAPAGDAPLSAREPLGPQGARTPASGAGRIRRPETPERNAVLTSGSGLAGAGAAAGCEPPPASPLLVQLEAPPQPAAADSAAVQASVGACGLSPAVVTALTGQSIHLQNAGPTTRQIQIDRPPVAGAEFTEGDRQSLVAGASVVHAFDRPGLYPVWCDGSAQPCGYLAVAANPQFALVNQPHQATAPLDVRFNTATPAPGPRPVAVYQLRRRALATSLTLDANGAGQLRLDPAAGVLPLATLALNDCRLVRDRQSPVAHACMRGGIREAKREMKSLLKRARAKGLRFECDSCHRNDNDWQLTDDARANFTSMLAAAGT